MVRELLAAGARVDEPDSSGETALMCAAIGGHDEVAAALLGAGADVNTISAYGKTALSEARAYERCYKRPNPVTTLLERRILCKASDWQALG